MEQSIYIRRKYHRTLNTYHLFESFLYGEFYSKVSETDDIDNKYLESLENNDYYIDKDFIDDLFDNIWDFSEQIDVNPVLSENFINEILSFSNENDDIFKLTKEFDLFDFDYTTLDEIRKYSLSIIKEHNGKIKMKHFFKNYNIFLKGKMVSKYRVELLTAEDNICLN
jgi:hypothetical protein